MSETPFPDQLWGRDLRGAVLVVMDRERFSGPLQWTAESLERQLLLYGFQIVSSPPRKVLADALGHEVTRGRVVRVARGRYVLGAVAGRTRRRLAARLRYRLGSGW